MALDYQAYLQYLAERNIAMQERLDALGEEQQANLDSLLRIALDPNSANQEVTFSIDGLGGQIDTLPEFLTWYLEQNGGVALFDPQFDLRALATVTVAFNPK